MSINEALKLLSDCSCIKCEHATEMSSSYCYYWTCTYENLLGESMDEVEKHAICNHFRNL